MAVCHFSRRATLLLLAFVAAAGGAETPRTVAIAALAAWADRDPEALLAVADSELKERCRDAAIVQRYLNPRGPKSDPLAAIIAGHRDEAKAAARAAAAGSGEAAVFALLFAALNELSPRSDRFFHSHRFTRIIPAGDLAIAQFASRSKAWHDPAYAESWRTDVVLRRRDGTWRFLWSPEIALHVSPGWNPRPEIVKVTIRSDGRTSISISDTLTIGRTTKMAVELGSGTHELIGRRPGYRDARWIFIVSPELQPIQAHVVCTEKLK